jgi:N-acetylglutamate synthase-like GNAT family acetyltransferase
MHRAAVASFPARIPENLASAWLARRWYYTPRSRRAYSVRPVSPGDRRLLAEFVLALNTGGKDCDQVSLRELTSMLFDRVIVPGNDTSVGFAALESTQAGDRVIGACAYAPMSHDGADFTVAVANSYRDEQVGRTLLATLVRHAKRVGVRRLTGGMAWSNRPMQLLAQSMGFAVAPQPGDRTRRLLALELR